MGQSKEDLKRRRGRLSSGFPGPCCAPQTFSGSSTDRSPRSLPPLPGINGETAANWVSTQRRATMAQPSGRELGIGLGADTCPARGKGRRREASRSPATESAPAPRALAANRDPCNQRAQGAGTGEGRAWAAQPVPERPQQKPAQSPGGQPGEGGVPRPPSLQPRRELRFYRGFPLLFEKSSGRERRQLMSLLLFGASGRDLLPTPTPKSATNSRAGQSPRPSDYPGEKARARSECPEPARAKQVDSTASSSSRFNTRATPSPASWCWRISPSTEGHGQKTGRAVPTS